MHTKTSTYKSIQVNRTAHYQVTGPISTRATTCTLACHGYGQLATYITDKFEDLTNGNHRLVSTEGLNKFYWQGTGGAPVATWMTSHHRQDEIQDYSRYLNQVYDLECDKAQIKVLFGFSQGGTTLWRWILRERPDFDIFINWAGDIPPDVDYQAARDYLQSRKLVHLYSETDQYITPDRSAGLLRLVESNGLEVEFIKYEGGHRIIRETLYNLYQEIG